MWPGSSPSPLQGYIQVSHSSAGTMTRPPSLQLPLQLCEKHSLDPQKQLSRSDQVSQRMSLPGSLERKRPSKLQRQMATKQACRVAILQTPWQASNM